MLTKAAASLLIRKQCWLFLLSFVLFCSLAYAKSENHYRVLRISIKNNLYRDCVLGKYYVLIGKLAKNSPIPEVIFREKEVIFYMTVQDKADYLSTAIIMSFQCGEDKAITLFTSAPTVNNSSVLEKKNISARFTTKKTNNWQTYPWEVSWVLNELNRYD